MTTYDVQVDTVLVGNTFVPVEAENKEEAAAKVDRNMVRDAIGGTDNLLVVDFQVLNVEEQG
jgi:hypothetical protein